MRINARIHGLKELDDLLNKTLPEAIRLEVMRASMHVAARPMVQEARARYRVGGSDSLSLATRSWSVKRGRTGISTNARYSAVVHFGPKRDNRTALTRYFRHYYPGRAIPQDLAGYGVRHAHLVEFGTGLRASKYGREWNGSPPQRVLDRTATGGAERYVNRFRQILGRNIDKAVDRGYRVPRRRTRR